MRGGRSAHAIRKVLGREPPADRHAEGCQAGEGRPRGFLCDAEQSAEGATRGDRATANLLIVVGLAASRLVRLQRCRLRGSHPPYTLGVGADGDSDSGQRRPWTWSWLGPSRWSRPPLRLVSWPPLWLAASSPLVVILTP